MMNIRRVIGSFIGFTLSLFATLFLTGSAAYAQSAPPWVTIADLTWAGTGCPPGSVASSVAPDKKAFSLLFSQYVASIGPGVPITENRKNCNLLVRLRFPAGWSFTIFTVDYRGYALLDRLVQGTQRSAYFFEGSFPSAALRTNLVGPFDDNYEIRDILGLSAVVWSRCSDTRGLNINTEVRLNNWANRNGRGLITTDNVTGELTHIYGLLWRQCSN